MLLYEATHMLFPAATTGLRERASRAFTHGEIKNVCAAFGAGNGMGLTNSPIEPDLKTVAAALVDLQDLRHKADYDLSKTFDRVGVLPEIQKVENAFAVWKNVRNTDNAKIFLTSLLLHSRWNKQNS
jgi:hypothetical protein